MGSHKGQSLTNVCSKISLEPTACFSTEQLSNTFVHNNQSSLSAHLQLVILPLTIIQHIN